MIRRRTRPRLLPISREEMAGWGWDELDVLLVAGDAYVDHPSFGPALLGRWLVDHGFRVGLVPQPRWDSPDDIARLGRPRLFVGVTAGALDSMLAHYTAFGKKRSDDAFTPGGLAGARPNRASIVYSNLVRQAFPGSLVVLGGIEASLRRITHYDFWTDKLRRSILLDAKADLILYGMAEAGLLALARGVQAELNRGGSPGPDLFARVPGAVFCGREGDLPPGAASLRLPGHEEIEADPAKLLEAALALERHVQEAARFALHETLGRTIILTPPAEPLSTSELDRLYGLPFTRRPHPSYAEPIPAEEMIRSSVTAHRGCGGGCSFCSLALHQGRRISSRSRESILNEVKSLTEHPSWNGSISDVGGPSANMWGAACAADPAACRRSSCLFPSICGQFKVDQGKYVELLRDVKRTPGVRHVRVASGLRYDLALKDPASFRVLAGEFIGGQLKIAPEHLSDPVLKLMRKPGRAVFLKFLDMFREATARADQGLYIIPYLMSAFPGCVDQDMKDLSAWLKARNWRPRQVQCFIPTPGTVAAAMFYSGLDPEGRPIPVARSARDRARQHAFIAPPESGKNDSGHDSGPRERRPGPETRDDSKPGRPT
ncbi:MAG: YgiQ family radical SAM protein [Pseudomonadota bacterium]